jgi:hypothetical protein
LIIVQLVHFRVNPQFFAGQFVMLSFVFMDIPGGSFIPNISKGQRPVPNPEKQVGEP